jgi:hypothetical protein
MSFVDRSSCKCASPAAPFVDLISVALPSGPRGKMLFRLVRDPAKPSPGPALGNLIDSLRNQNLLSVLGASRERNSHVQRRALLRPIGRMP